MRLDSPNADEQLSRGLSVGGARRDEVGYPSLGGCEFAG